MVFKDEYHSWSLQAKISAISKSWEPNLVAHQIPTLTVAAKVSLPGGRQFFLLKYCSFM